MQSVPNRRLIAYYRVSTDRQGRSRLGLEAQQAAVEGYVRAFGGEVVDAMEETETGTEDRPVLRRVLAEAKRRGAAVVVAKLDRMARNVPLFRQIIDSGAEVVFCELPVIPPGPIGKLFLTLLAAFAEFEAGLISDRTREALSAYRRLGRLSKRLLEAYPDGVPPDVAGAYAGKLGSARPGAHRFDRSDALRGSEAAARARSGRSRQVYAAVAGDVLAWRRQGLGYRDIARRLNEAGLRTPNGAEWGPGQVGRVLEKFAEKAGA